MGCRWALVHQGALVVGNEEDYSLMEDPLHRTLGIIGGADVSVENDSSDTTRTIAYRLT